VDRGVEIAGVLHLVEARCDQLSECQTTADARRRVRTRLLQQPAMGRDQAIQVGDVVRPFVP